MKMNRGFRAYQTTAAAAAVVALAALLPQVANAQTKANDKWATIVLPAEPNDIEPCHSSRAFEGRVVKYNITETLIQKNPADGKLIPRLALSWEPVDATTWRFKLREGVKYHDGTPFDAAAAKAGLDRNWSKPLACGDASKFFTGLTLTITADNPTTLTIKTSKPDPILPMRLTGLVIPHPKTDLEKVVPAGQGPIGTGPFVFDSWPGGQQLLLKRNENYWGKKPEIEGMRYIWRNESAVRASMIKIGEGDIALTIAPQDATDPATDYSYLNSETSFIRFDFDVEPTNDKRVRLAMNYALDLDALPGTILPKGAIRATQMVMPAIPGHNHDLDKKAYKYDPAKAKALLAEAKASGVNIGKEMTFVVYPAHYANAQEVMESMHAQWTAVGLNIKMIFVEPGQYQEFNNKPYKEGRNSILQQSSHDNNFGDPVFSVSFKYGCEGATAAMCDKKFDAEVERVSALGGEERVKGWQEVFRYLYEDAVASVMMFHQVGFTRVSPRVDFKPDVTTNAEVRGEEIHFTKK